MADSCMFKHSIYHGCGRKGHIRKVCKSSRQQYRTQKPYQHKNKDEHYINIEQEEEHWNDVEQTEEEVDNNLSIV